MVALRTGVGLESAIAKAREVNMPKENIDRLLNRFNERKNNLIDFYLEGFGPESVPMMIEISTDNKNRVVSEIKLIFKENDGNLGENGSVAFMFDKVGAIEVDNLSEEKELELIDKGAIDFDENIVYCQLENLSKLEGELGVKGEIIMKAKSPIVLQNEDQVVRVMDFIEKLEENEDVVNVFVAMDYVQKN